METAKAIGILEGLKDQTPDGRVRRKAEEAIKKVQKNVGSDKAVKRRNRPAEKSKSGTQESSGKPGS